LTDTTYEEAIKCPRCDRPGEVRRKAPSKDGRGKAIELHTVYCTTVLCKWYETAYIVQVNADGSIPPAHTALTQPKLFPAVSAETETRIQEAIQSQLEGETSAGGLEVRNPRSER
jgi:hypothetical protein